VSIEVAKWNWISNEEFISVYEKMYNSFSITVPEFRRILASFGLRFNWLNDINYFMPVAIGDIIKFEKNTQDKYVGYEKNGKILLSSISEPGFYKITSIPRREPTFNQVFARKEVYDLFPEMSYYDARKVFEKYGLKYHLVNGPVLIAWKQGLNFVCVGTLAEDMKRFTSFDVIVPSNSESVMVGFDGKDSTDYRYNLMRTVRDAFLQTLLEDAESHKEHKLIGYVNIPDYVDLATLPEGLTEVLANTINFKAGRI
jgi:hypothetical protein